MSVTRHRKFLVRLAMGGAALGVSSAALAQQIDVSPPLPNVLLLLDTSGSMEKMISGADPEAASASTCNAGTSTSPNRWGVAVQALTGDVYPYYSCSAMSRASGGAFDSEYKINGISPYDVNYHIPFHRPVSGSSSATACVYGPGTLPGAPGGGGVGTPPTGASGNADDFPTNAIAQRLIGTTTSCSFRQLSNGILDSASDIVRFGLMTFDTEPDSGIGVTTGSTPQVLASPFTGQWSYYPGWSSGTASTFTGNPANCLSPTLYEVGARNSAAPPWEGRLMMFPNANATTQAVRTSNDNIQLVINSTRPYGSTPIAGMLEDAKYFFWTDPKGPQQTDDYVKGNCRDEYIILLTDGAPNMDMRPDCEATGTPNGKCPYSKPEDTAAALYTSTSNRKVSTFVIGFAVSSFQDQGTLVQCSSLVQNGSLSSVCSDASKQATYGPCCTLAKIAIAGGTGSAYFADTAGDLNRALGDIMARIGRNTTSRTVPAYSPAIALPSLDPNTPTTSASTYLSSFLPTPGQPWAGTIQRQRFLCNYNSSSKTFNVPAPSVDVNQGDDFQKNLNSHSGPTRNFLAVQPDALPSPLTGVDSTATIRPNISATQHDGLGKYSGTTYGPTLAGVIQNITATALNITSTSCSNQLNNAWLTADNCKALALNFTFGSQSTTAMPDSTFTAFSSRYDNAFGDIFHATPVVVPRPSSLLRDEAYQGFAQTNATRKTVVYATTNDGLLHAFDADAKRLENNELWAFLPPAVMPSLLSQYPANHQLLLDGAPIVKDVIFERTKANVLDKTNWHTMLVGGLGTQGRGYYALDVTDPVASNISTGGGPKFRWQLTKMATGERDIFGAHAGTPVLTHIYANPDGLGKREIGVAILPGGWESSPSTTTSCARATKTTTSAPPSGYAARANVRCWGSTSAAADPVIGRSVAVVRVDTGEILRVFMRSADAPASLTNKGRVINTALDSPMTGIPVVYPAETGAIAQKFFMGDADGTVWKFDLTGDLTSGDATQQWYGELYLDAHNQTVDTSASAWSNGQPVQVAPLIALDRTGNVTVTFATGDQDTYTATGTNYVYSTTEKIQGNPAKLRASVNWYVPLTSGERVSGPMAIFDSVLYFATFAAANASSVCTGGTAKLWGRDFVTPEDTNDLSKGGIRRLQPPTGPVNPAPANVVPASYDSTLAGKLIPGVSISFTPVCADLSSTTADQYVPGTNTTAANSVTGGSYSLFAQVGGKNTGTNGTSGATYSQSLSNPKSPTMIDSWASILE